MAGIPNTATRSSHAVTIRVNGITIGMIQSWAPNQARPTTAVYELNSQTTGDIIERVPNVITGTTVNVNRVDLFNSLMEEAWGPNFALNMLTDQTNPLSIREKWSNPDGKVKTKIYQGCWFTSLGRNLTAEGDKVVRVNATLDYVKTVDF